MIGLELEDETLVLYYIFLMFLYVYTYFNLWSTFWLLFVKGALQIKFTYWLKMHTEMHVWKDIF